MYLPNAERFKYAKINAGDYSAVEEGGSICYQALCKYLMSKNLCILSDGRGGCP
jgi:hypothetical protein